MGLNKTRETWEDSSAESTRDMVGMEMAGVQPVPVCVFRQAIAPSGPHVPHQKRLGWTNRSSSSFPTLKFRDPLKYNISRLRL